MFIYGAGAFGREVAWLLHAIITNGRMDTLTVRGLTAVLESDPGQHAPQLRGASVITPEEAISSHIERDFVIALGTPAVRERVSDRLTGMGFTAASPLVHPSALFDFASVRVGDGSLICAGNVLTVDIDIGKHVHLNLGCTVGHDVTIGDYVTIAPGVHISGRVTVGAGTEIGTGATIRQDVTIGAGAVIGMGAAVTKDVPPGELWVGVPAKRR